MIYATVHISNNDIKVPLKRVILERHTDYCICGLWPIYHMPTNFSSASSVFQEEFMEKER